MSECCECYEWDAGGCRFEYLLRNIPGYIDFYLFLYIFNLLKSFLLSRVLYMSFQLAFFGQLHLTSWHK